MVYDLSAGILVGKVWALFRFIKCKQKLIWTMNLNQGKSKVCSHSQISFEFKCLRLKNSDSAFWATISCDDSIAFGFQLEYWPCSGQFPVKFQLTCPGPHHTYNISAERDLKKLSPNPGITKTKVNITINRISYLQ